LVVVVVLVVEVVGGSDVVVGGVVVEVGAVVPADVGGAGDSASTAVQAPRSKNPATRTERKGVLIMQAA
jgi:hypothetical protein